MQRERPISEDDLHAYVDDHLTADRRRAVEAYLAEHPEAAERVRSWQASSQALRSALAWKAREPVPVALSVDRLAGRRLRRPSILSPLAAGILLGLVAGGAGGWFAHPDSRDGGIMSVGQEAVVTHRMVSVDRDVVHLVTTDRTELARVTAASVGRVISPPDLTAAGYKFLGGEPITTEHGGACLFLYQDERGHRITLFVRPMHKRDFNVPMRPVEATGTNGYVWAQDGMGYSVVSTTSADILHRLSDQVRNAITVAGL
jgi:anti-sigma factor RsiW